MVLLAYRNILQLFVMFINSSVITHSLDPLQGEPLSLKGDEERKRGKTTLRIQCYSIYCRNVAPSYKSGILLWCRLAIISQKSNMKQEIHTINLSLPFRLGDVNCYLIEANAGFFLIDTGCSNKRAYLDKELESAGCQLGNLKLIILTHGDFDHAGNAAHLRKKFDTRIAMHRDDVGMVEHGNILWNRRKANIFSKAIVRILTLVFFRFGRSERFKPDFCVEDGYDLSEFGLDAKVLHIPGHSKGSIGILTAGGDLIGGDLILKSDKSDQPHLNSIIDDLAVARTSVEKLKSLNIKTVYPGHSQSFPMDMLTT